MKVRSACYKGSWTDSTLRVIQIGTCTPEKTYANHKEISEDKLAQVKLMCEKYISPSRWPAYVTNIQQSVTSTSRQINTTTACKEAQMVPFLVVMEQVITIPLVGMMLTQLMLVVL